MARSVVHDLTFPAQEHKLRPGQDVRDPATQKTAGEIVELDRDARLLRLKRGPSLDGVPLPHALIPGSPYWTRDQEDALERIGRSLLNGAGRYPAIDWPAGPVRWRFHG